VLSVDIRQRLRELEGAIAGATSADVPALLSDLSLGEWGELLLDIPAECSNLRARFPSMPTAEDQTRWTGAHGTGLLAQSVRFVQWLVDECDPRPGSKVLDFGCGWGRLMRLLYKYVDADNLYGVDPWSESLRVCREQGVIGHLALSEWFPRTLPFPGPFDLIYAFSVFTHLSEETTAVSLETLRRYIADDGALAITVRPPEIWDNIEQPNMIAEHNRRGFAFSPLNNSATYGDSSITTEYLTQTFPFWRVEKQLRHGEPYQNYLLLRAV
jgi:trans-aconitate methyltransferase